MAKKEQLRKIFRLCGPVFGCLTVEFYDDKIVIKNGRGGAVTLNKEEWEALKKCQE